MATRRVMSAGTLTGDKVKNADGEELGEIEEFMIDIGEGKVAYAVLSYGGIVGLGGKLFAVPWNSLVLKETEHEFMLDVSKERLEEAPGFDKDNWPDMSAKEFEDKVVAFYGG